MREREVLLNCGTAVGKACCRDHRVWGGAQNKEGEGFLEEGRTRPGEGGGTHTESQRSRD